MILVLDYANIARKYSYKRLSLLKISNNMAKYGKFYAAALSLVCLFLVPLAGARAQGSLSFEKTVHNFGDIQISDGPVRCSFPFKNTGNAPVVIHEVVTSCGCTTPRFSREPVLPGASGSIEVEFSNNQGPYMFDKTITVYHSASKKPVVLHVKGAAHDKKKTVGELYPLNVGGVGFRKTVFPAGHIGQGTHKDGEIDIANTTGHKIEPVFTNVTPGLELKCVPAVIQPSGKALIKYTITANDNPPKWGSVSYSADISVKGQQSGTVRIDASIIDDFDKLSKQQVKDAPLPYFTTTVAEYGRLAPGSGTTCVFHMTNKGKSKLVVHAIESSSPMVKAATPLPLEVPAGGSADIEITLEGVQGDGDTLFSATVICNSPTRPMVNLFMSGIVRK